MKNKTIPKNLILTLVLAALVLYLVGSHFGFFSFGGGRQQASSSVNAVAQINGDVQEVTTELSRGYEPITVQTGVPVKWTIKADKGSINGCNKTMVIPEYGIEHKFKEGDNVIEFTPTKSGTIPYSCWMGMINSKITITDDLSSAPTVEQLAAFGADANTETDASACTMGCCD